MTMTDANAALQSVIIEHLGGRKSALLSDCTDVEQQVVGNRQFGRDGPMFQ